MIAVIDYGLGNIKAFLNIYKRLNIEHCSASSPGMLSEATHIILPGVGAFDHAMLKLQSSGMLDVLTEKVLNKNVPVLGICVGMQILANSSEEGALPGLGWISGSVKKFTHDTTGISSRFPLPHMGWNDVSLAKESGIFAGVSSTPRFYFLHSFYFECAESTSSIATSEYGYKFTCAVQSENIYGVQFHPEKSHHDGVQLLRDFANIKPC
jgi:glutamine amidotransferase